MALQFTVDRLKKDLRITHTALDSDIKNQIDECIANLEMFGINADEGDETIQTAIKLYCRANYTADTVRSAMFWERYEKLRANLQLARREASCDE